MKEYKAIKNMSDEGLIKAYKELQLDKLPKGNESILRSLQGELYREKNKTVPLVNVQYYVAMEMVGRFCKIND